jgi:hypothetical protein
MRSQGSSIPRSKSLRELITYLVSVVNIYHSKMSGIVWTSLPAFGALEIERTSIEICIGNNKGNVKLSLYQAVKAHRVVGRRGSHIVSRQSAFRWR